MVEILLNNHKAVWIKRIYLYANMPPYVFGVQQTTLQKLQTMTEKQKRKRAKRKPRSKDFTAHCHGGIQQNVEQLKPRCTALLTYIQFLPFIILCFFLSLEYFFKKKVKKVDADKRVFKITITGSNMPRDQKTSRGRGVVMVNKWIWISLPWKKFQTGHLFLTSRVDYMSIYTILK